MTHLDFTTPSEVTDSELSFGYRDSRLMPTMEIVPKEFQEVRTKWNDLFSKLFFKGSEGYVFTAKPGIDKTKAIRHLRALMRSWEPRHQHKEAACAWVMSLWFESIEQP